MDRAFTFAVVGVAAICILSLAFALLKPGLPSGHDWEIHAVRARLFVDALRQGQFPVRWTEWTWNGANQPLFNYYPVLFYYVVAGINSVIGSLTEAIKWSVLLIWWAGSLFMFLYARRFGTIPAAVAAIVYALTPYILVDIFVRAAYPELLAISCAIGALWALDRLLVSARPIYVVPFALLVAGIIVAHPVTLVIVFPLLAGYTLLLLRTMDARATGAAYAGAGFCLGVGVSAFYAMPAYLELDLVQHQLLTAGSYDYHAHFVYIEQIFSTFWGYGFSVPGTNDGMSFQFGVVQWAIIAATIVVLSALMASKKKLAVASHLWFWIGAVAYGAFFMLGGSLPLWESIKVIAFVQYPWRFLMVIALACAVMSGILVSLLPQRWHQVIVALLCIVAVFIFYHSYLAPETFYPSDYLNLDATNWRESAGLKKGLRPEDGYFPVGAKEIPLGIDRWTITEGKGTVEEKILKNQDMVFTTHSETPFVLRVNTHYFPGWKLYVDNAEVAPAHQDNLDFMSVSIPTGEHTIEARFTDTPLRSASNVLTVLSLFALLLWQAAQLRGIRGKLLPLIRGRPVENTPLTARS